MCLQSILFLLQLFFHRLLVTLNLAGQIKFAQLVSCLKVYWAWGTWTLSHTCTKACKFWPFLKSKYVHNIFSVSDQFHRASHPQISVYYVLYCSSLVCISYWLLYVVVQWTNGIGSSVNLPIFAAVKSFCDATTEAIDNDRACKNMCSRISSPVSSHFSMVSIFCR